MTDKQEKALEYVRSMYNVRDYTVLPEGTIEFNSDHGEGEYGLILEDGRIEWPNL